MVKLVAQQAADSLSIKEWGNARLDVVQNPNGDNFIVVSSLKKFWAEEVFFYDNKNILIKILRHIYYIRMIIQINMSLLYLI